MLLLPLGDSRDHPCRLLAVFRGVVPRRQSDKRVEVRQDVSVDDLFAIDLLLQGVVRLAQARHERTKVAEGVREQVDPQRSIDALGLSVKLCLLNAVRIWLIAPVVALVEERPEGFCQCKAKC